ncbi:MAG: DUF58 domain-containing protein [Thermoflexales bacterium]|nr:DUF58 domain-containing protein [Thermoflexales bacterium]MDW8352737.1 DUF58 domain-containing protein [Anaerolineae bacterium]
MTSRATLLSLLITAAFLSGLAVLNGGIIALALPLLIYLGLALVQRPEGIQMTGERSISPDRVAVGEPTTIRLRLTNDGASLSEAYIEDAPAAGLEVISGQTGAIASLAPGESLTIEYVARGPRGVYRLKHAHVVALDGFGLFQRRAAIPAFASLLVQPTTQRLRPIILRPPRTRGFAGPIPSRQGGAGVDFFGLREYQAGDRLRTVNWRAGARYDDRIFSNVFEQERIADIGLILDAREQNDVRTARGALFEHAVQATASLAEAFLDAGNRVGLLVYGGGIESVFPGYGRVQRDRLLRALARATVGHHFIFEKLDRLPTRFFPAQSQIVFVGTLLNDDAPVLGRLRALGYAVLVVSPDPIAFELQTASAGARAQYAIRIARAERRLNLQALRRHGVQVVDWDVTLPLDAAIQAALARQPAQRRTIVRVT